MDESIKFKYTLYARRKKDAYTEYPDTVVAYAANHCAINHKKWNDPSITTRRGQIEYQENLVKCFVLSIMGEDEAAWFQRLPIDVQNLPLRNHEYYPAGDTILRRFKSHFRIPTSTNYAQQNLRSMSQQTTCKESYITRLETVKSLYDKIEDCEYDLAVSAFMAPFRGDRSQKAITLKNQEMDNIDFNDFYESAMRVILKEHTPPNSDGEGTSKEPRHSGKRSWRDRYKDAEEPPRHKPYFEREPYLERKPKDAASSLVSSLSEKYTERYGQHEDDTEDRDAYIERMLSRMEESPPREQSHHSKVNTVKEKPATQMQTPPDWNTFLAAIGQSYANSQGQGASSSSGGQRGSSSSHHSKGKGRSSGKGGMHYGQNRSHVNTVNQARQDRPRVDLYKYSPKGNEDWKKWFRVCWNCRSWGAHFGHSCKDERHPANNTLERQDPQDLPPLNAYPKDLTQALQLARSEYGRYGSRCKWNCPPALQPQL